MKDIPIFQNSCFYFKNVFTLSKNLKTYLVETNRISYLKSYPGVYRLTCNSRAFINVQHKFTHVCVSGGKKCSLFGKFYVLCFLETPIFRFALLPYYWRTVMLKRKKKKKDVLSRIVESQQGRVRRKGESSCTTKHCLKNHGKFTWLHPSTIKIEPI